MISGRGRHAQSAGCLGYFCLFCRFWGRKSRHTLVIGVGTGGNPGRPEKGERGPHPNREGMTAPTASKRNPPKTGAFWPVWGGAGRNSVNSDESAPAPHAARADARAASVSIKPRPTGRGQKPRTSRARGSFPSREGPERGPRGPEIGENPRVLPLSQKCGEGAKSCSPALIAKIGRGRANPYGMASLGARRIGFYGVFAPPARGAQARRPGRPHAYIYAII